MPPGLHGGVPGCERLANSAGVFFFLFYQENARLLRELRLGAFGLGKVKADGVGRCTGLADLKDGKCEANDSVCGAHTTMNDQGQCIPDGTGCGWATVFDESTRECAFHDRNTTVPLQLITLEFCRLNPTDRPCRRHVADSERGKTLAAAVPGLQEQLPACQDSFLSPACAAAYRAYGAGARRTTFRNRRRIAET